MNVLQRHPTRSLTVGGPTWNIPILWILSLAWATGVIPAIAKGSLATPAGWILIGGSLFGLAGVCAFVAPGRAGATRARVFVVALGAAGAAATRVTFGTDVYESALFSLSVHLSALLILAGEVVIGSALASVFLAGATWSVFAAGGAPTEFLSVGYLLAIVGCALSWQAFARRLARAEQQFRTCAEAEIATREEAARALTVTRVDNALVSSGARRALLQLAHSEQLDDELHRACVIAEAGLRDHIRSPGLNHPLLAAEVLAARERGAEIRLLGASVDEMTDHRISARLASTLAADVRSARADEQITIRQHPAPKDSSASVVTVSDRGRERVDYDAQGIPIIAA